MIIKEKGKDEWKEGGVEKVQLYNPMTMSQYNRDVYSRTFARLLNRALKKGEGDASKALEWLDHRYKLIWNLLFTRHKAEISDAYMDVREHIVKRIKESRGAEERGRGGEKKKIGN